MSEELFWLTLTVAMTGVMWLPYVLNRIAVRGLLGAMGNPKDGEAPHSPWADRMMRAHRNAVENLVLFAALVLTVQTLGLSSPLTQMACLVYFFARLAHFVVYAAGIPVVRTLAFAVGFAAQAVLVVAILGGPVA
ncbi:MAG: MAPEG family protein [Rhodospirillaceae bacterium]|nr:MAPEG family protein [Rhodospirillaceae bacterium]